MCGKLNLISGGCQCANYLQASGNWSTDPWRCTAVDGYVYGRGVTDDKGPILATLYAVRELLVRRFLLITHRSPHMERRLWHAPYRLPDALLIVRWLLFLLQAEGKMDINVVFAYEGEEENGSGGFRDAISRIAGDIVLREKWLPSES